MHQIHEMRVFLGREDGAFTFDWLLQVGFVAVVCLAVLSTFDSQENHGSQAANDTVRYGSSQYY